VNVDGLQDRSLRYDKALPVVLERLLHEELVKYAQVATSRHVTDRQHMPEAARYLTRIEWYNGAERSEGQGLCYCGRSQPSVIACVICL
jgi:hypothetical protein